MPMGRDTNSGKMTREHSTVKLRMVSPLECTTPSSTGTDPQVENNSKIGLGRYMKNLVGSSGRASRFTTCSHIMP
jgi:hypothetical protein